MNDSLRTPPALARQSQVLRIAIVTETYPPEINGVAMTIGRMLEGLLRRGYQVQLVRPRQQPQEQPQQSAQFSEVLVRGLRIPRYSELRMGLPAAGKLRELWKLNPPDIVHVVTEGPLGSSAISAARKLRIPVCSDFHTNFHSYSSHYGIGFLKQPIGAYLRRFHNRTACTFVPTRELSRELEQSGYRDLKVVARGVDTSLFGPHRRSMVLRGSWGVRDDQPVVIYVGRIAPEKNIPLLLSAFVEMRRRRPQTKLVLVGDGPARASLQHSHPQHIFAGMRTGEDLATHYASGDVFLFPSLTETFGNVTLEAMASALAVVAYNYAAARERIIHGDNGLLAPFDDGAQFTRLGAELINDDALIAQLRVKARATAESVDWDRVIDEFSTALTHLARR